jgi:hypothetical protein
MHYFAFLGTGECDPNKGLKELLTFLGVVAGWVLFIFLLLRINHSNKSKIVKISLSVLLITVGIVGTLIAWFAAYVALACSPR